jgi:cardiolipin synthase
MVILIVVVFHVLGLVSSIHAIMTTRTEQGAIAWAVSLNTFPYVAVPAYWVLGRSRFQGYVTARRGEMAEIAGLTEDSREAVRAFKRPDEDISPAVRAAQRLAGLPYLTGNSVELLVDGDATFASILQGIDAAEEYILFQFFIVHDDEIGREVKAHLTERARAGVRVYFLYDEVGSHDLPRAYKEELREAGVEVFDFHTQKGPGNRFQLNFRNHRKVVVVDGKVAWVGGHNVGDEYLGRDPKFGHWRDTHVRIEGPSALGAQLSFAEDWYWATERRLDIDWTPVPSADGDIPVLILPSGPADELETVNLMFVHAINSARERRTAFCTRRWCSSTTSSPPSAPPTSTTARSASTSRSRRWSPTAVSRARSSACSRTTSRSHDSWIRASTTPSRGGSASRSISRG